MLSAEIYPRSADHINEISIITSYQVLALNLFENVAKIGVLILFTGQFLILVISRLLCLTKVLIELYLQRLMLIKPVILGYLIKVRLLWPFGLIWLLSPELLANPNQLGSEYIREASKRQCTRRKPCACPH